MPQFSFGVRYLKNLKIHEEFLEFVPLSQTIGLNIYSTIIIKSKEYNLDISKLRGQGYNGASNKEY